MITVTLGASYGAQTPVYITDTLGSGYTVYINSDTTNCKLSYIHGAGVLSTLDGKKLKEIFDLILKNLKGSIILNTIQKPLFDFIKQTYPVYYAHEVPTGYNNKFQYHVCFKNTIVVNGNCKDPKELLEKPTIERKLLAVLKSKRRKTDYVEEFIKSL